ncbi:MAG TPA: pilus assembly protein CpaE, partial [Propionibacteriaceae bacterium]
MISRDLARRLAPHVSWTPANGDMFFIPRPEIVDSIFTVSDMVVELVVANGESRFHFNGTVEWALDSVESDGVVWLPRENQLREMLG